MLDRVGIVRAVPFGVSNDEAAELLDVYPDRFIGLARISALHGMRDQLKPFTVRCSPP